MKKYYTQSEVTQLSYDITGYAIRLHKAIGPGLLESVYENCLKFDLQHNGYDVVQQRKVPVNYNGFKIDTNLRLDLMVNDCIIIELKAVEYILPVHEAQLLTYMNLLKKPQGLLINFFTANISKSMRPLVNQYFKALPK
jgi:GxxExxY protein